MIELLIYGTFWLVALSLVREAIKSVKKSWKYGKGIALGDLAVHIVAIVCFYLLALVMGFLGKWGAQLCGV